MKEEQRREMLCSSALLKPLNLPRLVLSLQSMLPMSLGDTDEDKILRNMTQLHYNITYERSDTERLHDG